MVVLAGLNDAVTPLGNPETVKATALLNPLVGATVSRLFRWYSEPRYGPQPMPSGYSRAPQSRSHSMPRSP